MWEPTTRRCRLSKSIPPAASTAVTGVAVLSAALHPLTQRESWCMHSTAKATITEIMAASDRVGGETAISTPLPSRRHSTPMKRSAPSLSTAFRSSMGTAGSWSAFMIAGTTIISTRAWATAMVPMASGLIIGIMATRFLKITAIA